MCKNQATYVIHTSYGTFYICSHCNTDKHMPVVKAGYPIMISVTCQCEHYSHFDKAR